MKGYLLVFLGLVFASEAFAAKRDFKGLFGSYRREKFTENEARATDFGMDILLSTLLPLSPLVKSAEDRVSGGENLHYATFFNLEASVFMTLSYYWKLHLNLGYYTYETRKENQQRNDPTLPLFHQFEMTAYPLLLGVTHRFSTSDIVPYLGVAAGVSFVRRKGFYDYNSVQFDEENLTVITGQVIAGLEFFFSPRAGIRLEVAAHYMKLPARTYDTQGAPTSFPLIHYQGNPWAVRYASGVFFLF